MNKYIFGWIDFDGCVDGSKINELCFVCWLLAQLYVVMVVVLCLVFRSDWDFLFSFLLIPRANLARTYEQGGIDTQTLILIF